MSGKSYWLNLSDRARAKQAYENQLARLSRSEEEAKDHRIAAIFAGMRATRLLHRAMRAR